MKKLRGRRRQQRRATWWQQLVVPLMLAGRAYDYRKIWLRPWSDRLFNRQPPPAIRRDLLTGLLRTYAQWHDTLRAQPESFYLAVWIDEAEFSHSQVVAGVRERIGWYETLFDVPVAGTPQLPAALRSVPGIERLTWRAYYNETPHWAADWADDPAGWRRLLRHPYRVVEHDGEPLYVVRHGRTWVGQLREPAA